MNTTSQERTVCSPRDWHPLMTSLFIIGLTLSVTMTQLQAQEPRYVVKDIGTLPGLKTSQPTALNSQGEVTGTATAGEFDNTFLYFNGARERSIGAAWGSWQPGIRDRPGWHRRRRFVCYNPVWAGQSRRPLQRERYS